MYLKDCALSALQRACSSGLFWNSRQLLFNIHQNVIFHLAAHEEAFIINRILKEELGIHSSNPSFFLISGNLINYEREGEIMVKGVVFLIEGMGLILFQTNFCKGYFIFRKNFIVNIASCI